MHNARMHGILGAALLGLTVLVAGSALAAEPAAAPPTAALAAAARVSVEKAWVPQPPPGAEVAAAYFTLRNTGHAPAVLVDVSSPLASETMLHETKLIGGESRMRMLERLVIPPGGAVTLTPGAIHVMLAGLRQPLMVGQQVPLVLRFADGQQIRVLARVRSPAARE
jgi:periplasmic copper chaperone A